MATLTGPVARILYAIPFGVFGLFHFMNAKPMGEMVLAGWPIATVLVIVAGVGLLAACVAIIANRMARLACLLLAALLLVFVVTLHIPGIIRAADEMARMMPMIGLLKDISLMGGALTFAGILKDKPATAGMP
ncbi:MAG: DoxX family membrane protein [Deltaproteobacteria bacterium]|nr:DoxX family membrane protein [Deltaproteobacteria bacterium]